jgi:hypothetical protein
MSQTTAVRTPSSYDAITEALVNAGVPTVNSVRILAAQSAFETAGWTAMWNWNLGNILAANSTTQQWVAQSAETLDAGYHYLAFNSLDEGAAYYFHWLNGKGVLGYADAGDIDGYASALQSRANYLGTNGNYAGYKAGIIVWLKKFGGQLPSTPLSFPPGAVALGVSLLALGGIAYAYDKGYFETFNRRASGHG